MQKKENFGFRRRETIVFYGNLHDLLSTDIKDKVKKMVYDLWKQKQGTSFDLFKKIFISNKVLDKEELYKYLEEVFLKNGVSSLKNGRSPHLSLLTNMNF